jgi:L-ascorbate metabolism protein UlaG (beta-lactamase superfamily)
LDITWLGHSCFRIKGKEVVIITDPVNPNTGYSTGKLRGDIVTLSHSHAGHSYIEAMDGEYKVIKSPGEYEIKGIFINVFPSFHDNKNGAEKGKNNICLFEIEGLTICHLGDIGQTIPSNLTEEISDVGVLFIPVGGISTIDGSVAADIVRNLSPKIVIPMHYKTPEANKDLEPIDKFLKKMGIKEIESQVKLSVNRSTIPLTTQVIVLKYPNQP